MKIVFHSELNIKIDRGIPNHCVHYATFEMNFSNEVFQ